MGLLSPHFTLGGYYWWKVVRKNKYFVLQQHKAGPPIWFAPQFRILLRCNNYLIAEASTKVTHNFFFHSHFLKYKGRD